MGIETRTSCEGQLYWLTWLNGLGSPMGIETPEEEYLEKYKQQAKWPGKPDGD